MPSSPLVSLLLCPNINILGDSYLTCVLMKVAFAAEMRRRLPQDGSIAIFACHPGECTTDIVRTLPAPLQRLYNVVLPPLLITADRGTLYTALPVLFMSPQIQLLTSMILCIYIVCNASCCRVLG